MIKPFLDTVRALSDPDGRWLALGKGPSFARLADCDIGGRRICTLNHVIAEQPADLAHIADLDVVEHCGDVIRQNARFLVMPWRPHGPDFEASHATLDALATGHPVLGPLAEEGRLLCYNLTTGRHLPPHPDAPWIEAGMFSGAVVADLLVQAGAREIRTLGIDGGGGYAGSFKELEAVTLLSNGAQSYDSQFAWFAKLQRERGLAWGPLYTEMPLRVVIVAGPAERLAAAVLAHGLSRRTGAQVNAEVLDPTRGATAPGDLAARAGGSGRVLRLEPDLVAIGDTLAFWMADLGGAAALSDATGGALLIDAAHTDDADTAAKPNPSLTPFTRRTGTGAATAIWQDDLRDGLTVGTIPLDLPRQMIREGHAPIALTEAFEFDPATAETKIDDAASWSAELSEALKQAAQRRVPRPSRPTGWRTWPGRLGRKAARWSDARLGLSNGNKTPQSKS